MYESILLFDFKFNQLLFKNKFNIYKVQILIEGDQTMNNL